MHSIAEVGTNVPAFLGKLWKMVEDPVTNDLISWSSNGTSFVIKDETRFARELLPMYYKHNNMASFIRQLNMYGFHKIVSPEAGAMKVEAPDEIQFSHPFFIRGHSYLLDNIKRKIAVSKIGPTPLGDKTSTQVLGKVLTDVRQMKGRQENIDSRLESMKLENGALWRELSVLRQKHIKQQQMVNKLIQFLVTLVHQNPSLFNMKRSARIHGSRMLQQNNLIKMKKRQEHSDTASNATNSPAGPIIHELEDPAESLMNTVVEETEVETEPVSPSQVTNYFLNESELTDDVEDIEEVTEMPFIKESDVETLIGIPEDTLIFNSNKSKQINKNNMVPNIIYSSEQGVKQPRVVRSNFNVKVVNGKSKSEIDFKQRVNETQQIVMKNQEQTKQNLQQQIKLNQQMIQKNKEEIVRTEKLKRNQQQLLKNQQEILRNRQILLKNHQEIVNNQQLLVENKKHSEISKDPPQKIPHLILNRNPQKLKRNQELQKDQPTNKLHQQISLKDQHHHLKKRQPQKNKHQQYQNSTYQHLPKTPLERNQQQLEGNLEQEIINDLQHNISPDSESILLGDSCAGEPILSVDGQGAGYSDAGLPIIVEVPALGDSGEQHLSSPVPQSLLLGSPLVKKDLPQSTPDTSPSASNVEVICLEEPSPNIVISSGRSILNVDGHAASLPIIVEVPPHDQSEGQNQHLSPVPQDLLLGSPLVHNDPTLTPQSTSAASPIVTSPSPSSSNMQVACLDESQVTSPAILTSGEMGDHVETMQADLDTLKELLRNEGITIDANAILGCFSEDPLSFNISDPVPPSDDPDRSKENNGNELMAYNSPLFDFTDLLGSEWSPPPSPSEQQPIDNSFEEIHTPQFVPQSPSFPIPAKRRKK